MQFESVRFLSSVGVIFTYAAVIHIMAIVTFQSNIPILLTHPLTICSTFMLLIWFKKFGQWMSRARRATFNEKNLLLTYQPRALTHGHLFVPDPPTPARAPEGSGGGESCTATEFRKMRDEHYKDEFHKAINSSMERNLPQGKVESMRIEFDESGSPASSSTKSPASSSYHI
ncbi:unnamed protein product [Caenorhabditis sp. 36 PRJEB53466]|nr:unnamed protein product [Caenorhabditis sp. 36 PRJEB53466]